MKLTFCVVVLTVVCLPLIIWVTCDVEVEFGPKLPALIDWNTFDISGTVGNKSLPNM